MWMLRNEGSGQSQREQSTMDSHRKHHQSFFVRQDVFCSLSSIGIFFRLVERGRPQILGLEGFLELLHDGISNLNGAGGASQIFRPRALV